MDFTSGGCVVARSWSYPGPILVQAAPRNFRSNSTASSSRSEERDEEWLTGFAPLHNVGEMVRTVVNALLDGVAIEDDALPSTAMDRRISIWVYLVEHPVRRLYKIGITVDPDKRLGDHIDNGYVDRGRWYVGERARSVEQTVIGGWRSAGHEPVEAAPDDGHTETVSTMDVSLSDIYSQVAAAITG
jgi:hypothetical protein